MCMDCGAKNLHADDFALHDCGAEEPRFVPTNDVSLRIQVKAVPSDSEPERVMFYCCKRCSFRTMDPDMADDHTAMHERRAVHNPHPIKQELDYNAYYDPRRHTERSKIVSMTFRYSSKGLCPGCSRIMRAAHWADCDRPPPIPVEDGKAVTEFTDTEDAWEYLSQALIAGSIPSMPYIDPADMQQYYRTTNRSDPPCLPLLNHRAAAAVKSQTELDHAVMRDRFEACRRGRRIILEEMRGASPRVRRRHAGSSACRWRRCGGCGWCCVGLNPPAHACRPHAAPHARQGGGGGTIPAGPMRSGCPRDANMHVCRPNRGGRADSRLHTIRSPKYLPSIDLTWD